MTFGGNARRGSDICAERDEEEDRPTSASPYKFQTHIRHVSGVHCFCLVDAGRICHFYSGRRAACALQTAVSRWRDDRETWFKAVNVRPPHRNFREIELPRVQRREGLASLYSTFVKCRRAIICFRIGSFNEQMAVLSENKYKFFISLYKKKYFSKFSKRYFIIILHVLEIKISIKNNFLSLV